VASLKQFFRAQEVETASVGDRTGRGQVWTRRGVILAALVVASSCLSPTLPLPPPNKPDVEGPDASGNVTLTGEVIPGASVYANNLNSGVSAGQRSDSRSGKYRFEIAAKAGDSMELFYIHDGVSSERSYFSIPGGAAPANSSPQFDAGVQFGAVDAGVAPPR
jgi:hypothetical protein